MNEKERTFSTISKQTLHRLPLYLNYLKSHLQKDGVTVSATCIADALQLSPIQVRKDLAMVSSGGRPKTGYQTHDLLSDIEHFLGYDHLDRAVLVGVGHLGRALLSYRGFAQYGLEIVAAFDCDETVIGTTIQGLTVVPDQRLPDVCHRLEVQMGIITVPAERAQVVCDRLVESGIRAIWNFAPVHLTIPQDVLVQNENLAASFAVLSKRLAEQQKGRESDA